MAKKKKKRLPQRQKENIKLAIAEEILALEAIYGEDFQLHEDGIGFALKVVPHPGALEDNFVTIELHVR
jgi:hypothetical protein